MGPRVRLRASDNQSNSVDVKITSTSSLPLIMQVPRAYPVRVMLMKSFKNVDQQVFSYRNIPVSEFETV